jgi:hypothetical protein
MKKVLAGLVLAGGTFLASPMFAGVSVGIGLGVPLAPAPVYVAPAPAYVAPAMPGPGYAWVDGYWYVSGGQRLWHPGFWRAPVVREGFRGGYARGFRR